MSQVNTCTTNTEYGVVNQDTQHTYGFVGCLRFNNTLAQTWQYHALESFICTVTKTRK